MSAGLIPYKTKKIFDGMGRFLTGPSLLYWMTKFYFFCNPTQVPCCLDSISSKNDNGKYPVNNFVKRSYYEKSRFRQGWAEVILRIHFSRRV